MTFSFSRGARLRCTLLLATATTLTALAGCAPLLLGGALVGGSMMAADRRTSGTQIEDQAIELKARNRIAEAIGDRGNVSVTSYNRTALITGEVRDEADKAAVAQAVSRVENVRAIVNELQIAGAASLTSRSNDAIVTSKVKASFVDARDISANYYKVVTERGVVYLMGRVTEAEATRATELARSVPGVQKVVRLFEILSQAEVDAMRLKPQLDETPKPAN